MRRLAALSALCAILLINTTPLLSAQPKPLADFGIVLMHGKGGQPGSLIDSLATALRAEGAEVIAPKMAWSGSHGHPDGYTVTYEQSLVQVDRAIETLKAKGVKRIVVAGHSLGANAAIGYAARRKGGLAAVIALAPGHTPELMKKPAVVESVAVARQMVASGKKDAVSTFADINVGHAFQVRGTARAYLSFFDPEGPAVIPRNAAAMPAVPLLWVVGRSDPIGLGRGYAFSKAAKHPKSKYLEVDADHAGTPHAARGEVIAWLKLL